MLWPKIIGLLVVVAGGWLSSPASNLSPTSQSPAAVSNTGQQNTGQQNTEQQNPVVNAGQAPASDAAATDSAAKKPASGKVRKSCKRSVTKAPAKRPSPKRVVVHEGGTVDSGGQLSAGVADGEASHQRESTSRLLSSTDSNLKIISGRKLTPDQQDTLRQVNMYVQQSRLAIEDGDFARARNLALKAHLLSDSLVRR
jgi:hypothetical protein